jgi:hypothetical protein
VLWVLWLNAAVVVDGATDETDAVIIDGVDGDGD